MKRQIISSAARAKIVAHIDVDTTFDASTIRIDRDGWVSAKRDPNKTSKAPETARILIGHADALIALIDGGAR